MAMIDDFYLEDRLVRPNECRIGSGATEISIDRMAMRVLSQLVARAPAAITREELLDEVWGGRAVTDEIVTAAVSRLRRALGDRASAPRYIETLPGHGYRLVAEVHPVGRTRFARPGSTITLAAAGASWRRLAPSAQFGTASLVGIAAYLAVACLLLA